MTSQRIATLAKHIATCGSLGDYLPAPGTTAGSLPAALIWWAACSLLPHSAIRFGMTALGLLLIIAVGTWACDLEARRRNTEDPGPIVVDEIAGQWLTYAVAMPVLSDATGIQMAVFAGLGFLLFRVFDVTKPWPVWRFEKLPGGVGIMADDLAAAIYAGICLVLAVKLGALPTN